MVSRADIHISVLGTMRVEVDGVPIHLSTRLLGLLAMLTMRVNHVVSRSELFTAMWPELDEDRAANNLGYTVAELRKRLGESGAGGGGWIQTESPGYRLEASPESLDVLRFEQLLTAAKTYDATEPSKVSEAYGLALATWEDQRGTAYRNLEHTEFCQMEIHRLRELWAFAVEERIAVDLDITDGEDILPTLAILTREFPYRERLWGFRMKALYRTGRQTEALQVYGQVRSMLGEDLGIEPSLELQALEEQVLLQSLDLAHRDGAGSQVTPPPRSLRRLIGRETDIATISRWIDDRPLVTLVGLGGVGKTRLAAEIARITAPRFDAEPVFVDLSRVSEPQSLSGAIASACGLRQHSGRPSIETVVEFLRAQRRMLVLDNCEHVLAGVATRVHRILEDVMDTSILATSRVPIAIEGELVHRVHPLETSGSDGQSPAVQLLIDSSPSTESAVEHHSATELVTRLGGMPLAIELAAKQLAAVTVDHLLLELTHDSEGVAGLGASDASATALQDACDWSYRVLSNDEKRLFRILGLITGGISPELLVEYISAVGSAGESAVSDRLSQLVQLGLIERVVRQNDAGDRVRWTMLEPVRQFAEACLIHAGEMESAIIAHAAASSRIAVQLARSMMLDPRTAETIAEEEANFTKSLQRSLEVGRLDLAATIACSLDYYWVFVGRVRDGRRWIERVCAMYPDAASTQVESEDAHLRASLARSRGFLASIDRDYVNGVVYLERSILMFDALAEQAGDDRSRRGAVRGAAWARMHLARNLTARYFSQHGFNPADGGDAHVAQADALYRRAAEDLRRAGFERDRAYVLPFLGWNTVIGNRDESVHWFQEAISLAEDHELEIPRGIGEVTLAWFLLVDGTDAGQSRSLLEHASATFRRLGDIYSLQISLTVTAIAALQANEVSEAVEALVEALDLMALQGGQEWGSFTLGLAAVVLTHRRSDASNRVVEWLDATASNWRNALASSGLQTAAFAVVPVSSGDEPSRSESQVARIARAALLDPSAR